MVNQIPLSAPDITQREIDAVVDVLRTTVLAGGPKINEFERACALACNRREAVATSSGSSALHCILLACGVQAEDEVITTPFACVSAANCILTAGARPVFVDINPKTLNLDVDKLEAAITPKTRAILAVEAMGHPGGMEEIEQFARRHELTLLENASQGFGGKRTGRPVGSYGRASCVSFHSHKQITTGEGGMIITDDDHLADLCRSLRDQGRHGMPWAEHARLGYSYRMSEIGAALGLVQLLRMAEILEKRRRAVHEYFERLMENRYLTLPTIPDGIAMSWTMFFVRLNDLFEPGDRDEIIRQMHADGIECGRHFPAVHLQPHIMATLSTKRGAFPVCEYIAQRTIALPLFSGITTEAIDRVCESLDQAIEKVLMGRCQGRF